MNVRTRLIKEIVMNFFLIGSVFIFLGVQAHASLITLSETRLQQVCNTIADNFEKEKLSNSLPQILEHTKIVEKVN